MTDIRYPAVAGSFYPSEPQQLATVVQSLLEHAHKSSVLPKAIIAPHAGYSYSGAIAASAYASLFKRKDTIQRVVLLGPAHRIPFLGLATSSAKYFLTPLGSVAIDEPSVKKALQLQQVQVLDQAHADEHCLEVHLPFLQVILQEFSLVPFVVGECAAAEVAEVLDLLWGGEETLIVISSDLSHYHDYHTANAMDKRTSRAIENLEYNELGYHDACGSVPLSGMLLAAKQRRLQVTTLDLRNSGDTAGPRDQVVGYGAYSIS